MTDIRHVTPRFAVSPQLAAADFAAIAAAGFKTVINNRPDGESPDQLKSTAAELAAELAGLTYAHLPISGPPSAETIQETARLLKTAPGPILAYCRSGTRSITAWALAQIASGERPAEEVVGLARSAGYDLSGLRRG